MMGSPEPRPEDTVRTALNGYEKWANSLGAYAAGDALAALDELVAERDALKDEAKGMQIVADHFKAERDHWRQLAHDMGDALGYVQDDWRDRVGIQHPSALLARLANSTRSRA